MSSKHQQPATNSHSSLAMTVPLFVYSQHWMSKIIPVSFPFSIPNSFLPPFSFPLSSFLLPLPFSFPLSFFPFPIPNSFLPSPSLFPPSPSPSLFPPSPSPLPIPNSLLLPLPSPFPPFSFPLSSFSFPSNRVDAQCLPTLEVFLLN